VSHVIVVPVFNEAATLSSVIAAARRHGPVLVVDDGSVDGSGAVAERAGAEVARHPRRLGKGEALRTGFAVARSRDADLVVTLDGDGQHDAADLPALLAAAARYRNSLVIGSRLGDAAGPGLVAGRRNAVRIAGFFVNWASGLVLEDTQSGFRVYPRSVVEAVDTRRGGFVFETEVLIAAAACGCRAVEVPVKALARERERSRFRPLADGLAVGAYLAGQTLARWRSELLGAAWWRQPRRQRIAGALGPTLGAPFVLGLVLLQTLMGDRMPDVVTPLVSALYGQARLGLGGSPGGAETEDPRLDLTADVVAMPPAPRV
jgi:glycosyltransferase involved in cell wall biosynthesis